MIFLEGYRLLVVNLIMGSILSFYSPPPIGVRVLKYKKRKDKKIHV